MRDEHVPQQAGRVLAGHRKAIYAQGEDGRLRAVASAGWEAEEIVNALAVNELERLAEEARARALAGLASPLEFHMYRARMDLDLLAQTSGFWRWRIRRHFRPAVFARLKDATLARYAEVLGCRVEDLRSVEPR
ncbi:hypothetical protein [Niveibacterium terrae]|uniref:hypothetical protein n=1 Tax=Niveibacterium terrae TaxID=3373598 RepID=UPI003A92E527